MMGFTDNHRKQVKFFTNTPMTLQSKNMFLVQRIQYIGKMSSWDPNLGLMLGLAVTHCVLLEHYYSVYFPWWFDRKISFFSVLEKNREMTKIQNCTLQFDEKTASVEFCQRAVWTEINLEPLEVKRMDGSSWKKNSIASVFILLFAG